MQTKEKLLLTIKIIIPLIIVICLFSAGITTGIITFEKPALIDNTNHIKIKTTLKIIFTDDQTYTKEFITNTRTVYGMLLEAEKIGDIEIEQTYWEQFDSYVIDSITYNDVKYEGDASHYWAFYKNGEAAMQGADKTMVNNNDIIEWKYESF